MLPRGQSPRPGAAGLVAAIALAISFCAAAPSASAADGTVAIQAGSDVVPGADRAVNRPPATFFTINEVLAKLDRLRARGPGALRLAELRASNIATDAPLLAPEPPPVSSEPFGLFPFRAPDGALWRKWHGVEADIAKDEVVLDRCRADPANCPSYAAQFLRLINAAKAKSGRAQLDEANQGVNIAIRYESDFAQWGVSDRWSSPLTTFATGKGDCEDYAIAKYVALSEAGFPVDDLRLVLAHVRGVREDHAVLAARLDGHWLILDNRRLDLMADSEEASFTPLFDIDHRDGVQLFAAPYVRRAPLDGEAATIPAAASGGNGPVEWTGEDGGSEEIGTALSTLPSLV